MYGVSLPPSSESYGKEGKDYSKNLFVRCGWVTIINGKPGKSDEPPPPPPEDDDLDGSDVTPPFAGDDDTGADDAGADDEPSTLSGDVPSTILEENIGKKKKKVSKKKKVFKKKSTSKS